MKAKKRETLRSSMAKKLVQTQYERETVNAVDAIARQKAVDKLNDSFVKRGVIV